jgi:hypothetical protein
MSGAQPVEPGCELSSDKVERSSHANESGASVPGCLTSKDEERETWTAESLRISGIELRLDIWGRTKDFDGRRFKGNTMVACAVKRG